MPTDLIYAIIVVAVQQNVAIGIGFYDLRPRLSLASLDTRPVFAGRNRFFNTRTPILELLSAEEYYKRKAKGQL